MGKSVGEFVGASVGPSVDLMVGPSVGNLVERSVGTLLEGESLFGACDVGSFVRVSAGQSVVKSTNSTVVLIVSIS